LEAGPRSGLGLLCNIHFGESIASYADKEAVSESHKIARPAVLIWRSWTDKASGLFVYRSVVFTPAFSRGFLWSVSRVWGGSFLSEAEGNLHWLWFLVCSSTDGDPWRRTDPGRKLVAKPFE
jgi:hypothetical protein